MCLKGVQTFALNSYSALEDIAISSLLITFLLLLFFCCCSWQWRNICSFLLGVYKLLHTTVNANFFFLPAASRNRHVRDLDSIHTCFRSNSNGQLRRFFFFINPQFTLTPPSRPRPPRDPANTTEAPKKKKKRIKIKQHQRIRREAPRLKIRHG